MTQQQPLNAQIVHAGDGPQDAVDLGAGVYLSRGVSNAYLVTTEDGDAVINTGMPGQGDETRGRFARVSSHPVRKIIFTQSHPDHIGGYSAFAGSGVETITQANFAMVRAYWRGLEPFYLGRTGRLWGRDIVTAGPVTYEDPLPDRTFHDSYGFTLGGRQIELLSVPGGETLDSLVVWLPNDRIVFTGNLTGPLLGHVPNLYTIRGDKIRSVAAFVSSVQRVIDLRPEVLVTGHGEPVRGEDEVRRQLTVIRDAAQYLWDQTWAGMNAGIDLWTLMGSIKLPPELDIPQGHGKVPWIVRAIWEEHGGWFRYESTTELYDVPPQAVWPDLIELAGGVEPVMARANDHLGAGRPLEALHLVEMALSIEPDNAAALHGKLDAVTRLLVDNGRENFSEVRWLEAEIRDTGALLDRAGAASGS